MSMKAIPKTLKKKLDENPAQSAVNTGRCSSNDDVSPMKPQIIDEFPSNASTHKEGESKPLINMQPTNRSKDENEEVKAIEGSHKEESLKV